MTRTDSRLFTQTTCIVAMAATLSVVAETPAASPSVARRAWETLCARAGRVTERFRSCVDLVTPLVAPPTPEPRRYGITFVTPVEPRLPQAAYAARFDVPTSVVILVHGLDDPGWMWRDVIPALQDAGYVVARMEYPNDGPIRSAADRFAAELVQLKRHGVEEVTIIGHSMGGLVTRDVLTRKSYYAGDATGRSSTRVDLPSVKRFIMCGTPNAGSELARLRAVSEIGEQVERLFREHETWLGLADGQGEAARDLLPGSAFLEDLNARPMPLDVEITIIAGRMQPFAEDELAAVGDALRGAAAKTNAPQWLRRWIDGADRNRAALLDRVANTIGDGCVTLDSAQLDGVTDVVVVEADHISLVTNITPRETPPPSVPVILDRLAAP